MASSNSSVIYIKSSGDFNFAMSFSSDDDIASLKKKAEAQHLDLFPEKGRIVAQAMKMWKDGTCYYLADDILVSVVIRDNGMRLFYMEAETATPDSPEPPEPPEPIPEYLIE